VVPSCLKDADGARTRSDQKVNDYSGTIVSERRRWRMHTLGPKSRFSNAAQIIKNFDDLSLNM
jgi:hypothetical protein